MSGDPHYEPAPMLWNRFDEYAGDARAVLRRRFHTLVDAAGLDEERARDWVVVRMIINAHWAIEDAQGAVEFYLAHRAHRLAQVETAVENGYRPPQQVVAHVYADVDRSLWPAAELSVRAQMDYLREHGLI